MNVDAAVQQTVLVARAVWDGRSETALSDGAIWIHSDGRIVQVGPADEVLSAAAGSGARVIELEGVIAPGLVNMHVHLGLGLPGPMEESVQRANLAELALLMAGNARQVLESGVTTVRLVGETRFADMALRKAIDLGAVSGPRIFTAGHALCCTGGHGHGADGQEADGADGFRRATREQIRAGADLIKVCISGGIAGEHEQIDTPQLTDEEMSAVLGTAHDWGRKVTAHAGPAGVIERAVQLGLDGIEHGYQLTESLCAMMAERQVWYTPTISVSRCEEFFIANKVPRWMIDRALSAGERHWQSLQFAIKAGVPIVMGTDMPPQAAFDETTATIREMEFMVEAGMTPLQVMRSATSLAADWLGAGDRFGVLAAGAQADLILLDKNPVLDISALRGLHGVMQAGQVVRDDHRTLTQGHLL